MSDRMRSTRKRPLSRLPPREIIQHTDTLSPKDAQLACQTQKVLATLTPREEQILRLRFGIPDRSHELETLERFALSSVQMRDAVEEVCSLTPQLLNHLKCHEEDLEKLPWDVFEHLVAEFLASWGHYDVRLVGHDKRTQADVIAIQDVEPAGIRLKYFVEVKRTHDRIGIQVINQIYGAFALEQPRYGWSVAMIVSLGGFTDTQRMKGHDIKKRSLHLKNASDVIKWLRSYTFSRTGLWLPNPQRRLATFGRTKHSSGPA